MDHNQIVNEIANANLTLAKLGASDKEYIHLYPVENFNVDGNKELRKFFAKCHQIIIDAYLFHNHEKRIIGFYLSEGKEDLLLDCLKAIYSLQESIENTPQEFKIDEYYDDIFKQSIIAIEDDLLATTSTIDFDIKLPLKIPIFSLSNTIKVSRNEATSKLYEIGKGSFATVYKFHDSYLGIDLALKRAHKNSTDKILERFKKEFEKLHNLDSPYIIDVYSYNDFDKEYTMEFIPTTLKEFLDRNPSNDIRYLIVKQLFKVLKYIHSVDTLHRDLSYNNVLIKEYEDGSVVIKLCDFGLMKDKNFDMTSTNSEAKATHLAPEIFSGKVSQKDFDIPQEIFSLAIVIKYIMTAGTEKTLHSLPKKERDAIEKGMSSDPKERYQTIDEFQSDFF